MKTKPLIIKELNYSIHDHQWHSNDDYTFKVLDANMLSDGAISLELRRIKKGSPAFIYRLVGKDGGLWRIGHKNYDVRFDTDLYEFYMDIQNALTKNALEVLHG